MKRKNGFFLYTCMWVLAIVVLMVLLLQSLGDARIVNYSGIVRGATQKLVKEEMAGHPDDELILELDDIIYNLKTGEGKYNLNRNNDSDYQEQLANLEQTWNRLKAEIQKFRLGQSSEGTLFDLSQQHFTEADQMVLRAEQSSDRKLVRFIILYGVILVFSICIFGLLNRRARKTLENSIYTDNLTGMLNRLGFEAQAPSLLRRYHETTYCLIEFDIDDFKFLNNSYGYELGDSLLCLLADRLKKTYHTEQLCARIAADDFLVLIKYEPQVIDNLRVLLYEALKQEALLTISEIITFTIGAYELLDSNEKIQSVMDKANMAHKNAKVLGKSVTTWYNEKLLEKLKEENHLKNRMRRAMESGEFKMYLQPKYTLSNQKIYGAEALIRWEMPGNRIIPPDSFIPLFERNGYIAEVDFYMLEKACDYIQQHRDTHGDSFSISVNFSRVTIYHQNFYSNILEIVDRFDIPHSCIEIEITESAFNEISDVVVKKLIQLQEDGFVLSMDDFGSGYSNLNLLDKLPIQILKLDQEFLRTYAQTAKVKNVISCVIELSHSLDIKVVCEGIEKKEHIQFLQENDCDYGQGYYFSKPIPQEEFCLKYESEQF